MIAILTTLATGDLLTSFNVLGFTPSGKDRRQCTDRRSPRFTPLPCKGTLSPAPPPLPLVTPSGGPKVRDGVDPHPLVDVFVDRVRALIEGALEEQGAHGDGKREGGGSAE